MTAAKPLGPAAMRRKIEKCEALLAAEKTAHSRTFDVYRENLYELVDCRIKLERIERILDGGNDE